MSAATSGQEPGLADVWHCPLFMWHFIIQPNGLLIELNANAVQWMEMRWDLSWLPWPAVSLSLSLSLALSCEFWCPGANYSGKDTVIVWVIFWVMKGEDKGSNDLSCLMTPTDPQILTPIRVHVSQLVLCYQKQYNGYSTKSFFRDTFEEIWRGKLDKDI